MVITDPSHNLGDEGPAASSGKPTAQKQRGSNPWLNGPMKSTLNEKTSILDPSQILVKSTPQTVDKKSMESQAVRSTGHMDVTNESTLSAKFDSLDQAALVKRAFAGDDIVSGLISHDLIDSHDVTKSLEDSLPGWGRWTRVNDVAEKKRSNKRKRAICGKRTATIKLGDAVMNAKIIKGVRG
jgi:hypothetical protein